jgi:hypothetical protein
MALCLSIGMLAEADVVEYENAVAWHSAVGSFTTIGFDEVAQGTIITEQYADLGVHFTDGTDVAIGPGCETFPQDCWGLKGHIFALPDEIHLTFDTPQKWIGIHFPGGANIELYRNGEHIYSSTILGTFEIDNFGGLVSTIGFDEAVIWDSADGVVFIDDLHFGVPAPSALPLLALAGVIGTRTRRRSAGALLHGRWTRDSSPRLSKVSSVMTKMLHTQFLATLLLGAASQAEAEVTEFTDFAAWQQAGGAFTTITFAEFPAGTLITDQYADQGVTFSGGFHQINCCSFPTFPGDGSGLNGLDPILLTFRRNCGSVWNTQEPCAFSFFIKARCSMRASAFAAAMFPSSPG